MQKPRQPSGLQAYRFKISGPPVQGDRLPHRKNWAGIGVRPQERRNGERLKLALLTVAVLNWVQAGCGVHRRVF